MTAEGNLGKIQAYKPLQPVQKPGPQKVTVAGFKIPITSQNLLAYIKFIKDNFHPYRDLTSVQFKPPTELYQSPEISLGKPEELKLHPEVPNIDSYQPSFSQKATSLTVLYNLYGVINSKAKELIVAARNEQKLVGATANV